MTSALLALFIARLNGRPWVLERVDSSELCSIDFAPMVLNSGEGTALAARQDGVIRAVAMNGLLWLKREGVSTMKAGKRVVWAVMAALAFWLAAVPMSAGAQACTVDRATGTEIDAKPFLTHAMGPQWNAATNRIAYMAKNDAGYYRVYIVRPDGTGVRDLTAGIRNMPVKHQGAPYWDPSGRYLLLVAEKPSWHGARMFGNPDYGALPGFGMHDDLWVVAADGSRAWQLTNEPDGKYEGVLIPLFSADGKRVAWSARQSDGKYTIKVADFVERPEPHLVNVRSYAPGGRAYYEPGSFSTDGQWLLYTSDQDTHNFWFSQIYRLNLTTGESLRLTHGRQYNEHPVAVATPSGEWVIYMSTLGVVRRPLHIMLGTEWYAMRIDGSGNKRLTTMNGRLRTDPEYSPVPLIAVKATMSPGGDSFLGDIQDSITRQTGFVKRVRFTCK
jgi:Tol biopolymer transport system component